LNADALVRDFADQLRQIAKVTEFAHISRLEMKIGAAYEIAAEELEDRFDDLLDSEFADSKLDGAVVSVTIVEAGSEIHVSTRDDLYTATGWDLLITKIDGTR
jgi:hypothetical protein